MSLSMYHTLVFALAFDPQFEDNAPGDDYVSHKRELLNGLQDILPCIVRWELEDLKVDNKHTDYKNMTEAITLYLTRRGKRVSRDPTSFYERTY